LPNGQSDERDSEFLRGQNMARLMLAAPTTHGFDLVAWIAPFAVFGGGNCWALILLVRRWSVGRTLAALRPDISATLDPAERERQGNDSPRNRRRRRWRVLER
jgi:transcriptional regulator of nitric oxide reductase